MAIPENIYEIILVQLAGEMTPEEKDVLRIWLEEAEEHQELYKDFCSLWYAGAIGHRRDKSNKGLIWEDIKRRHNRRIQRRIVWQVASVAACLLMILGGYRVFMNTFATVEPEVGTVAELMAMRKTEHVKLVLSSGQALELTGNLEAKDAGIAILSDSTGLLYSAEGQPEEVEIAYNDLIVPKGGEYRLTLADGTIITMNAESNLRFPVKFSAKTREVWLEGEAYFEVTHNPHQPFIVHTNHTTVNVLGTSFNVMAYQNEKNTEITLVKGSVDVGVAGHHELLVPGTQCVVNNSTLLAESRTVDVFQYISWKEGIIRFDDLSLEQLMNRLSRWYNIDIEFVYPELKEKLFSGGFKKYENMEFILKMIQETNDVNFKVQNHKIIIDKK